MYAVDLGACPGGWTYQLVQRNMWVSSVDNGPMAQSLMDTGQVTWLREDGFKYRPTRNNIMDGVRYGGKTGESVGAYGAVAGERLVS